MGHEISVETQGSVGSQNTLAEEGIAQADLVIIAADTKVDKGRFAASDPLWVIPSLVVGSAVAGAISMVSGCALWVPHGGIFVLPIPNAVTNLLMYIVAIAAGILVITGMIYILKRPVGEAVVRREAVAAADA